MLSLLIASLMSAILTVKLTAGYEYNYYVVGPLTVVGAVAGVYIGASCPRWRLWLRNKFRHRLSRNS